jgi:hypothetical protein
LKKSLSFRAKSDDYREYIDFTDLLREDENCKSVAYIHN